MVWEAVFNFTELFWRLFQHISLFRDRWFTSTPAPTVLNVQQFLTKNRVKPVPHPPYSSDLALSDFIFVVSPDEKSPQRETFCWCERGLKKKIQQKPSRNTNRHQNRQVQNLFWAVEKSLDRYKYMNWRVLWRWLKFKHVRIDTQFFIYKFWGF